MQKDNKLLREASLLRIIILREIEKSPSIHISGIETNTGISRNTLYTTLTRMESSGFVSRERKPNYTLTSKSTQLLSDVRGLLIG